MLTPTPTPSYTQSVDMLRDRATLSPEAAILNDRDALGYMAARLNQYAAHMGDMLLQSVPNTVFLREQDSRQHRVILMNASSLASGSERIFVGFFGQKRPDIDSKALDALDSELIQEFRDYPHLVSYSSLELGDGSWGNLVVMTSSQGLLDWATSARHARAAREVAPRCYLTIRLHTGIFIAGNGQEQRLEIRNTKYFDFTTSAAELADTAQKARTGGGES